MYVLNVPDTHCSQSFEMNGKKVTITVRFNPVVSAWSMDLSVNNTLKISNIPLSVGVPILKRTDLGFFFFIEDTSGLGIDPIHENDFINRCVLYVANNEEFTA